MRDIFTRNNADSGVSETVGFILIFGIMMTGIALVTLYGYPALVNAQADANIRNMERNMIVLQSDFNTLAYKSLPYKETTMQVSGGVLSVDPIISNFMIKDGNDNPLITYPVMAKQGTGAIQFISDTGEVSIALQNGAVVKHQSDGSVMLSKPRWFIDTNPSTMEETFVITLIQVDTSGSTLANSGISTVQMEIQPLLINDPTPPPPGSGDETNIVDTTYLSPPYEVKITIPLLDSKYRKAWENYFEIDLGMTTSDGITWTKSGIHHVIIKGWKINVINL